VLFVVVELLVFVIWNLVYVSRNCKVVTFTLNAFAVSGASSVSRLPSLPSAENTVEPLDFSVPRPVNTEHGGWFHNYDCITISLC